MARKHNSNKQNETAESTETIKSKETRYGQRRTGGKGRVKRKFNSDTKQNSTNDPSWYSQSVELLRDSSSIPFSWPVGTKFDTSPMFKTDAAAGICRLDLLPTIGTSLNVNSPVNVAASAIYSWVRHANSGHSNYDAPDLMMYLLAMSNVYSYVVWMQRLYGFVSMYDQRNRYLPQALVECEGIDFTSLRDNLANFRYFLNAFINKVASLAVPATMPIFNRLAFLYSNVYSEGPSIKDQLYLYHPTKLMWYNFRIDQGTGKGELVFQPVVTQGIATFNDIVTYANNMFNAIWDQEDFGIMSGDIIKAYDANVIKLSPVPEVMSMVPVYDAMVLHQMKNAKGCHYIDVSKISQSNNGEIIQSITILSGATAAQKAVEFARLDADKILSTDFDAPTPEVVIESTRLMPSYNAYDGVIYAGTEICTSVSYFCFNSAQVLTERVALWDSYSSAAVAVGTFANYIEAQQWMSQFKYHPEYTMVQVVSDAVVNGNSFRVWDIDNYAVLSNSDLQKMHETALLSLFAVPAIAKIS